MQASADTTDDKQVEKMETARPEAETESPIVTKETAVADSSAPNLARRAAAEFFAMAMFVWVGTGTAVAANHAQYNGEPEVAFPSTILLPIAMAFGFGITVLAGNLGAYSGGHVNPAVTLALVITRACPILDGAVYIVSQFAGAVLGSLLLWGCTSQASFVPAPGLDMETIQPGYQTGDVIEGIGYPPFGLGADHVQDWVSLGNAFLLEFLGTALLIGTVMMSAVDKRTYTTSGMLAAWPIGFSVMLAHLVIIPFTGCGINPARTFGPALVNYFAGKNVWQGATGLIAFYIAPFCASIVVGGAMPLFWGGKAPPAPKTD